MRNHSAEQREGKLKKKKKTCIFYQKSPVKFMSKIWLHLLLKIEKSSYWIRKTELPYRLERRKAFKISLMGQLDAYRIYCHIMRIFCSQIILRHIPRWLGLSKLWDRISGTRVITTKQYCFIHSSSDEPWLKY